MIEFSDQLDQLEIFENSKGNSNKNIVAEWGTFKDSLKAPIHRWFTYPAGYSYKAVEYSFKTFQVKPGNTIYDPFMGTGTTNLAAKADGINSYGIEAHPFVYTIAKTKLNISISINKLMKYLEIIENEVKKNIRQRPRDVETVLKDNFPELVLKCYNFNTLYDLLLIRNEISYLQVTKQYTDFFNVGLTSVLRQIANVHTGWPYIAPNKAKISSEYKNAIDTFRNQINSMLSDVQVFKMKLNSRKSKHKIFRGDSRGTKKFIEEKSIDFIITSPPYLNNYDYADRTRLEMYFFNQANTWGDITTKVRDKLITSATTQISRSDPKYKLSDGIKVDCKDVYDFLRNSIQLLGQKRLTKGGKKSYDLLVSGYFNDMYLVLKDCYRVLKPKSYALFILGDSAPYGIYIPTDDIVGKIGLGIGFTDYHRMELRTRGGKWKDNPQRHNVKLRESIVTLYKA